MSGKNYTTTIELPKPDKEIFKCITEVQNWWSKDFEGDSKNLNDEFTIHHPNQHYSKQKLVEVIPDTKLVWLVTESTLYWLQKDKHEWTNTKMIFEIKTKGNKFILQFIHEGLTPEKECYQMCEKGWSIVIKNWLVHFITYNTASPEMINAAQIRNQILNETATPTSIRKNDI